MSSVSYSTTNSLNYQYPPPPSPPASSDSSDSPFNEIQNKFQGHNDHYNRNMNTSKKDKLSVMNWFCFKTQKSLSPQTQITQKPIHSKPSFSNQRSSITFSTPSLPQQSPSPAPHKLKQPTPPEQEEFVIPKDALSAHGYIRKQQIAPTLQGEVFIASKTKSHRDYLLMSGYIRVIFGDDEQRIDYNLICSTLWMYYAEDVVIKTAQKSLYYKGLTITPNGKKLKIEEDIIKEAQLMAMFKRHDAPSTMIGYDCFMEDTDSFYVVMEQGGMGLFEFTVKCHKLIKAGKLSLKYWRKCVSLIFAKMVGFIAWMHDKVNCCNLDISLENIVMAKDTFIDVERGKIKNLNIRFIDFGLTEKFDINGQNGYFCEKYVGKKGYKAPKVYDQRRFMANKADIWSLGVCLFMLSVGAPPFDCANDRDLRFQLIRNGRMKDVLTTWDRLRYLTKNQYDLIERMLCIDEGERIGIAEVMQHQYIKRYFNVKNDRKKRRDEKSVMGKPCIFESEKFQCPYGGHLAIVKQIER